MNTFATIREFYGDRGGHHWTEEEDNILREMAPKCFSSEIAAKLSIMFGRVFTRNMVIGRSRRENIALGNALPKKEARRGGRKSNPNNSILTVIPESNFNLLFDHRLYP